ncbi:proline-rich receptor-like protein kinase PERK9 [Iris pallida]|uniref:Proline-rich receptor-like protein kinase PERK9 n=1 Tax=Iris pallida TaxID=29817 RepID=A0AAX6F0V6_IRIPA|nr:proline-rich receptor-like protein kinase PERK9 [Iris pallida]
MKNEPRKEGNMRSEDSGELGEKQRGGRDEATKKGARAARGGYGVHGRRQGARRVWRRWHTQARSRELRRGRAPSPARSRRWIGGGHGSGGGPAVEHKVDVCRRGWRGRLRPRRSW